MANKTKILVVDDDPMNLKFLKEILSDEYNIIAALSGEEALEIIFDFMPEILLLDIMMPGIDGYEVCKKIRANEKLANIKILLVSAKAMLNEKLMGYEVGADDYITKPFEHEELLAKIKIFIRQ
ncbi:MAG: response regulator [Deltaproteobacteria bacterium]|jgi:DNA-binding response OmpR family regulator|nr:response regulator [Deltaproteobacteria bacterium]MBT4526533.1 response regulator [Deltaproteobacteria bacterium]